MHLAVVFFPLKHPSPWQVKAAQTFPYKTGPEETLCLLVQTAGHPGQEPDLFLGTLPTPPNPLRFSICAISGISHPEISPPSDNAGNLTETPPQQTSFKLPFPSSSQGFAEMSIFPSPLLGCPSNTLHPRVLYSQLRLLEHTQGLGLGPLRALSLQSSLICSPSRGSFWKNSIAWTFWGSTYISGGRPGGGGGDGGRGRHGGGWQVTCRHERSPVRTQPMREPLGSGTPEQRNRGDAASPAQRALCTHFPRVQQD